MFALVIHIQGLCKAILLTFKMLKNGTYIIGFIEQTS